MKRTITARRRSRWVDARPAFLWFSLTLLLLVGGGMGFLVLHALAADWLDLKLESARVRVLTWLPEAPHPDFVPTPRFNAMNEKVPTIVWSAGLVRRAARTPLPTQTVSAPPTEQAEAASPTPRPTAAQYVSARRPVEPSVQLAGVIPEAQRFNNCGPTTLRMYLSFYGYTRDTQVEIANVLKPDKDDRNVSPNEIVGYAESKGFRAIARVNGSLDLIKQTVSSGMPIMIEEGYDPPRAHEGWMGHYLLITGYDGNGITAQDSYNGPNQHVSWQALDMSWRNFNRTYLLVYTDKQAAAVQNLLGDNADDATMYAQAAQRAQDEWNANPNDAFAAFNLGSSLVGLGEYEAAAQAFDQARELKLPWRMLWYQFGPYEAYYQVGRYEELIALADATQKPVGDLEESYYYKGLALAKLGRAVEARDALTLALKYNPNYRAAQDALARLGS